MIISKHHKRTAFKTRVVRRVSGIGPEEWRAVFPPVLESYNFFNALDETGLEQFPLYYVLVYDRAKLVGIAPCFVVQYSLDTSINGPLRKVSNYIKKINPNIFSLKTFICGMPIGQGRLGITGDKEKVMHAIRRKVEQVARKEKAALIAFKDFDHSYTPLLDPLQKESYTKFDSLPTTELNVWYKDFEDYLKTLSAASRYDLRRKFKKADSCGKITLEIVDAPDDKTYGEIYTLYRKVVDRHEMGFEVLPVEFFKNVAKNMPGQAKFFLWRIDNKLVTFLLCLVSEDMLIDYYVGLDYEFSHTYHMYFVKFRDVLNWCIKNKIKRYEMGITGYEPKRRLGFDFIPLYLYVKLRNRVLRPVFMFACQFLKFENFDPTLKTVKYKK